MPCSRWGRPLLIWLVAGLLTTTLWAQTERAPWIPLKLTVEASRTALFAQPLELRRANADTPRLAVEPIDLKFTLTNISSEPLRVNTYDFIWSRLAFDVTGPRPTSVMMIGREVERSLLPPAATDVITLKPGETWTCGQVANFPLDAGFFAYYLQDPGEYQVTVRYVSAYNAAGRAGWAEDAWQGAVAMEQPLVLQVVTPGAADHGLQTALAVSPTHWRPEQPLTVTLFLHNTTNDNPLIVPAWELQDHLGLIVSDLGHGDVTYQQLPNERSRELTDAERAVTIMPGKTLAVTWTGTFHADAPADGVPSGLLALVDRRGHIAGWQIAGDQVVLKATLAVDARTVHDEPAAGGFFTVTHWAGAASSAYTPITLAASLARAARLKEQLDDFKLDLQCQEPADKPYYQLLVQTKPLPPVEQVDPFHLRVQITADQARDLIDGLAADGWLEQAISPVPTQKWTKPKGYVATVSAGPSTWIVPLGWDAHTFQHLSALQQRLPENARPTMTPLLARLTGLQREWLAAAAPGERVALDVSGLTHEQAVAKLLDLLGKPSWAVPVLPAGDASVYSHPTHFYLITAGQAVKLMDHLSQ